MGERHLIAVSRQGLSLSDTHSDAAVALGAAGSRVIALESEFRQTRMVRWTRSKRLPQELSLFDADRDIVDAGFAAAHEPILVEFPLFIAMRAEPVARVVVPLILKAHRDVIVVEGPQFFDEPVFVLAFPFDGEERDDLLAALEED